MKVEIRGLRKTDASYTWMYRGNADLWKFTKCDTHLPATESSECMSYKIMLADGRNRIYSILADGIVVGVIKLANVRNGAAELKYYMLRSDLMGKGICSTAVGLVVDKAFDVLGLDLVYVYVDDMNVPSRKVMEKNSFPRIAMSLIRDGVARYEMTRTGWMNRRNRYGK